MTAQGGVDVEDERLVVPGCGSLLMVIDDDYGDDWWEANGVAARWTPATGWGSPDLRVTHIP